MNIKNNKNSENGDESFKVTGDWDVLAKQLKEKFSQLTDNDLSREIGKDDQLLDRIAIRLSKKTEEIIALIKSLGSRAPALAK